MINIKELQEKIDRCIEREYKQYPVNVNRASELGHPCIRYLVLLRTRWRERRIPKIDTLRRFKEGRLHEQAVLRELENAGFKIIEQQRAFSWDKYKITGSIDAKILINENVYPLEVKSSSEHAFKSINSAEDLKDHKWLHIRKYTAQMTLYLLLDEKEEGLFVFKNKTSGELKFIPLTLDYELGEELIKKAEKVNEYVKNEAKINDIERIEYDESTCGYCDFIHICLPEVKRNALWIFDDVELLEKLEELESLKAAYQRYQALDKQIKERLKGIEKAVIGDFLITGKEMFRKGYTVNDSTFWQVKIQNLRRKEEKND